MYLVDRVSCRINGLILTYKLCSSYGLHSRGRLDRHCPIPTQQKFYNYSDCPPFRSIQMHGKHLLNILETFHMLLAIAQSDHQD